MAKAGFSRKHHGYTVSMGKMCSAIPIGKQIVFHILFNGAPQDVLVYSYVYVCVSLASELHFRLTMSAGGTHAPTEI